MKHLFILSAQQDALLINIKIRQLLASRPIEINPLDDYMTEVTIFITATNHFKPD